MLLGKLYYLAAGSVIGIRATPVVLSKGFLEELATGRRSKPCTIERDASMSFLSVSSILRKPDLTARRQTASLASRLVRSVELIS